jgi:hypothetical protein
VRYYCLIAGNGGRHDREKTMTEITSTPSFIISELERRGIDADLEHTGGGCTAVKIELTHLAPSLETAYIMITDVSGTTCDLEESDRENFLGWVAGHYSSEDAFACGENAEWIHADAYERECEVLHEHETRGVPSSLLAITRLRVDWKSDALQMVDAIASHLTNLKG